MGVEANPITLTWIGGVGLSSLIASYFLVNEKTQKWSDKKIVLVSVFISFSFILVILRLFGKV